MLKKITLFVAAPLIIGLLGFSLSIAVADTAPPTIASTGSTYNVGTGVLAISESNATTKTTDFNLAKISITDGINNTYTLTTKNTGITFATGVVDVTLNAADELALSQFLNKNSTSALNSGIYQINVLSGWDGATSNTDLSTHALTVSGVVSLTSATYDMAGNLKLIGTGFMASGSKIDITPKYLTITDSVAKSYTLTSTGVTITDSTSATVILNAADKLALQSIFNNVGTSVVSTSGNAYNITAAYGWDGKLAIAQMGNHAITVSGNLAPIATVSLSTPVVYGKPITGITVNKVGTVYVVPASAFTVATLTGSVNLIDTTVASATTAQTGKKLIFTVDGNAYTYTVSSSDSTQVKLLASLNGVLTTHATATVNSSGYLVVTGKTTGTTSAVTVSGDASAITAIVGNADRKSVV